MSGPHLRKSGKSSESLRPEDLGAPLSGGRSTSKPASSGTSSFDGVEEAALEPPHEPAAEPPKPEPWPPRWAEELEAEDGAPAPAPKAARVEAACCAAGEFALALRCGLVQGDQVTLMAGCGIVAGSDPEVELAEARRKLAPMLDAIGC